MLCSCAVVCGEVSVTVAYVLCGISNESLYFLLKLERKTKRKGSACLILKRLNLCKGHGSV